MVLFAIFTRTAAAQTAVDFGNAGDGAGLSLALKSTNAAGLAYFNDQDKALRYSEQSGQGWSTAVVDSSLTQLATTVVDSVLSVPSVASLAYLNDEPHIFYYNQALNRLQHAYRVSGAWRTEAVDQSAGAGGSPSAKTCGTSLCVSYYDAANKNLRFAKGTTGAWTTQTVDSSANDVGAMNDLAVSANGTVGIAYYDATAKLPKLALLSGSTWSISSLNYLNKAFGLFPSITIAGDGTVHIVSGRFRSAATKPDIISYYARRAPTGTWAYGIVSDDYSGGDTGIALNAAGELLVTTRLLQENITVGNARAAVLSKLGASGKWDDVIIPPSSGMPGTGYSIAEIALRVDSNSNSIVAYHFTRSTGVSGIRYASVPATASGVIVGSGSTNTTSSSTTVSSSSSSSSSALSSTSSSSSGTAATSSSSSTPAGTSSSSSTTGTTSSSSSSSSAEVTGTTLRINAGSTAFTDSLGFGWQADRYYIGGSLYTTTAGIAGTTSDPLYQSERYGSSFSYRLPVTNGAYQIVLHFAEIFWSAPGKRVFDVKAEGTVVIDNLDIYSRVGKNAPLAIDTSAVVSDGVLDLDFLSSVDSAKVSAIEITPLTTPATSSSSSSGAISSSSSTTGSTGGVSSSSSTTTSGSSSSSSTTGTSGSGGSTSTSGGTTVRLNAGGTAFTDSTGFNWSADTYYGNGSTYRSTADILGTTNDPLYQTERYGSSLSYAIPVANGAYQIVLHFAEVYWSSAGKRVFDVKAEGGLIVDNLDIYAQVGRNAPLAYEATAVVTDGVLNLDFIASIDSAKVSAIEITPLQTLGMRINAGGASFKDSTGLTWDADRSFIGGVAATTTNAIAGTVDDKLYQNERWGKSFSYKLPVANGTYRLNLLFAETYYSAARQRVFTVNAEGKPFITNLDIYAAAGKNNATSRSGSVTVTDGELTLTFTASAGEAKVCGINLQ